MTRFDSLSTGGKSCIPHGMFKCTDCAFLEIDSLRAALAERTKECADSARQIKTMGDALAEKDRKSSGSLEKTHQRRTRRKAAIQRIKDRADKAEKEARELMEKLDQARRDATATLENTHHDLATLQVAKEAAEREAHMHLETIENGRKDRVTLENLNAEYVEKMQGMREEWHDDTERMNGLLATIAAQAQEIKELTTERDFLQSLSSESGHKGHVLLKERDVLAQEIKTLREERNEAFRGQKERQVVPIQAWESRGRERDEALALLASKDRLLAELMGSLQEAATDFDNTNDGAHRDFNEWTAEVCELKRLLAEQAAVIERAVRTANVILSRAAESGNSDKLCHRPHFILNQIVIDAEEFIAALPAPQEKPHD